MAAFETLAARVAGVDAVAATERDSAIARAAAKAKQLTDDACAAVAEFAAAVRAANLHAAAAPATVLVLAGAVRGARAAADQVAAMLALITTASAKNSFISRQLLAVAEQADTDATAAVAIAVRALEELASPPPTGAGRSRR